MTGLSVAEGAMLSYTTTEIVAPIVNLTAAFNTAALSASLYLCGTLHTYSSTKGLKEGKNKEIQ